MRLGRMPTNDDWLLLVCIMDIVIVATIIIIIIWVSVRSVWLLRCSRTQR